MKPVHKHKNILCFKSLATRLPYSMLMCKVTVVHVRQSEFCFPVIWAYYLFSEISSALIGGASVRGRYSHVAAVLEGRVLLVAGGYSGVARGDLVAYKVPLFVSSDPGDRVIHLDDTFLFIFLFSFFL